MRIRRRRKDTGLSRRSRQSREGGSDKKKKLDDLKDYATAKLATAISDDQCKDRKDELSDLEAGLVKSLNGSRK